MSSCSLTITSISVWDFGFLAVGNIRWRSMLVFGRERLEPCYGFVGSIEVANGALSVSLYGIQCRLMSLIKLEKRVGEEEEKVRRKGIRKREALGFGASTT
ncbi:hypothetical protein VNO77_32354 [Canavalia gladiata]|uniref:Uncharacterized protein n=1 Tax=Canavalia gladiata TaxID=3824 RepID=A0AAN9KPR2_CANGL